MTRYDEDFDPIPLEEQPEFIAYREAIEGLLSDEPLTIGAVHRTLGYEKSHWTMDALESLLMVAESIQYGARRAWIRRDLAKIESMGKLNFTIKPYSPPTL